MRGRLAIAVFAILSVCAYASMKPAVEPAKKPMFGGGGLPVPCLPPGPQVQRGLCAR